MFDIGFWELIVVAIVALFVIGPEKLPAVARVLSRRLGHLKNSYTKIKNEVLHEFEDPPPK